MAVNGEGPVNHPFPPTAVEPEIKKVEFHVQTTRNEGSE